MNILRGTVYVMRGDEVIRRYVESVEADDVVVFAREVRLRYPDQSLVLEFGPIGRPCDQMSAGRH